MSYLDICPTNFEVISDCQEKQLKTFVREKPANCAAFRKPTGPPLSPKKTVLTYLWYIAIGWCCH